MKLKLTILALLVGLALIWAAPTKSPPAVMVMWNASPDPIVLQYGIYWGAASRSYTNFIVNTGIHNTNVTITNLVRGVTYYFAATCISVTGQESDYSIEVSYRPPVVPVPPQSMLVVPVGQ
jgi:hypothetical protein